MQSVREAVETEADNIADTFYSVISSVTGSDNFLVDDLVETRLKKAMASWIRGLYRHRDTQELAEYIDSQLKIGSVHARINVPAHLLNTGIRVVKLEIHKIS
ncbi:MAG: protoglobin domain-containing protein [Pseudomonadota bacterium]